MVACIEYQCPTTPQTSQTTKFIDPSLSVKSIVQDHVRAYVHLALAISLSLSLSLRVKMAQCPGNYNKECFITLLFIYFDSFT